MELWAVSWAAQNEFVISERISNRVRIHHDVPLHLLRHISSGEGGHGMVRWNVVVVEVESGKWKVESEDDGSDLLWPSRKKKYLL